MQAYFPCQSKIKFIIIVLFKQNHPIIFDFIYFHTQVFDFLYFIDKISVREERMSLESARRKLLQDPSGTHFVDYMRAANRLGGLNQIEFFEALSLMNTALPDMTEQKVIDIINQTRQGIIQKTYDEEMARRQSKAPDAALGRYLTETLNNVISSLYSLIAQRLLDQIMSLKQLIDSKKLKNAFLMIESDTSRNDVLRYAITILHQHDYDLADDYEPTRSVKDYVAYLASDEQTYIHDTIENELIQGAGVPDFHDAEDMNFLDLLWLFHYRNFWWIIRRYSHGGYDLNFYSPEEGQQAWNDIVDAIPDYVCGHCAEEIFGEVGDTCTSCGEAVEYD